MIVIGIRFGLFINAIESGAAVSLTSRPPGVEGFLPSGALTSFKYLLLTGKIHPVHPAALIIFLTIVIMSLLTKKSFCSWLCPVGTISEAVHKLGRRLFGRNFRIWLWLDLLLRCVKYLLLLLFVVAILLIMSADKVSEFLDAPYWAVSDVKMLHFFTNMSGTTKVILGCFVVLSLFYKMFWCRYLCPYGALLGLTSMLSPFKIRRDAHGCTGCQRCSAVCPSRLEVHHSSTVGSPECTGCLTCVVNCPEKGVLAMKPSFRSRSLSVWAFPAVAIGIFMAGIIAGMVSGHWQTSLTRADYQRLVPIAHTLSH
ncbi:MAG: 4Fe-4S binding protein [Geobacter sp.]|nr:4Fe-4S binding protein [Geobacter sp.]